MLTIFTIWVALVALGVFLAYALCRAASDGDRMMRG